MLGVFALVVMTSVLDGVKDKVATGFAGMSWDGTLMLAPKSAETTEEQKRFAMSPGLRYEDLPRIDRAAPEGARLLPRAPRERSAVQVAGGTERIFVNGVTAGLRAPDEPPDRRSAAASPRTTSGGARRWRSSARRSAPSSSAAPTRSGATSSIEGVPYRIVGVQASGQIFNEELWLRRQRRR